MDTTNTTVVTRTIREVFAMPSDAQVEIRPQAHPLVPRNNPHFTFAKESLRKLLMWVAGALAEPGLWVSGPTGAGKSSLIEQFSSRLNIPVFRVPCTGRTTLDDLLGGMQISQEGGMHWVDGPIIAAMRIGGVLLLDEWDLVSPSESTGLNTILDGAPVLIKSTGEYVVAHPDFRVAATGNTFGWSDASHAGYRAVQKQNLASLDRFASLSVTYLDEATEIAVLTKTVPDVAPIAEQLVQIANKVRGDFISGVGTEKLSNVISTRGLIRWARATVAFSAVAALDTSFVAAIEGLRFALLDKWPKHEAEAVLTAYEAITGTKVQR